MRYLFIFSFLLLPRLLFAAEFFMSTDSPEGKVGESIVVSVEVNTQEAANLLAGEVYFDSEKLALDKITFGNSMINYWIERPSERQPGEVSYAGIIAGGFMSTTANVFSLHFRAKALGETALSFRNAKILAHDGTGQELAVVVRPLVLMIQEGIASLGSQTLDTTPPLVFTPLIISQKDIFSGKKVLIFDTTDKETGIDAYYVREYKFPVFRPFATWHRTISPYELNDQSLGSYVEIKADDRAGNSRVVTMMPKNPRSYTGVCTLVLLSFVFVWWLWKRRVKEVRI